MRFNTRTSALLPTDKLLFNGGICCNFNPIVISSDKSDACVVLSYSVVFSLYNRAWNKTLKMKTTGSRHNIYKDRLARYWDSHVKDKVGVRPSYL